MTIYDVIIKTLECELQPMNAALGGNEQRTGQSLIQLKS